MAETLRYPYQKIESSDDYLEIGITKYIPPGISAATNLIQRNSSASLEKPSSFIYLPIMLVAFYRLQVKRYRQPSGQ